MRYVYAIVAVDSATPPNMSAQSAGWKKPLDEMPKMPKLPRVPKLPGASWTFGTLGILGIFGNEVRHL